MEEYENVVESLAACSGSPLTLGASDYSSRRLGMAGRGRLGGGPGQGGYLELEGIVEEGDCSSPCATSDASRRKRRRMLFQVKSGLEGAAHFERTSSTG